MSANLAAQPCPDVAEKKFIVLFVDRMTRTEEERRKAEILAQGCEPYVIYTKRGSDDLVRVMNGLGYIDSIGVYRPHTFE
jgi:hypothetical protein